MTIVAKRCGVNFSPPSIVLIYEDTESNKTRQRIMPVRNFSKYSDSTRAAEQLKNNTRHSRYLSGVSVQQLQRLYVLLRQHLEGHTLEQSLNTLRPQREDLNKLSDEELAQHKAHMDKLFEKNRKRPCDPDFIYDLQVEFPEETQEVCSWDEDESDDGF